MKNIAYFVESYGKTSETFIVECLKGLSVNNFFGFIYVDRLSSNESPPQNFKIEQTYFSSKYAYFFKIFKHFKFNFINQCIFILREFIAYSNLKKKLIKQNPDLAYIEFGFNAVLLRKVLTELKIPFIVTFHGIDASTYFNDKVYCREILKVFRDSSKIIAVSNHIRRRLVLNGCIDNKINVVYNTINFEYFQKKNQKENNLDSDNVIFVGRLTHKKNPLALIHAFSILNKCHPNSTLTIIGNGPLYFDCKLLIQKLNITKNVELLGSMPNKKVFELLNNSFIYAQHSVTSGNGDQEGFGITLIEASAAGLPIVSTIHNGITESVNEETGILVPEYDYDLMGEKLIYLFNNRDVARKLGANGKERAFKYFNAEIRLNKIHQIINETLKIFNDEK